MEFDLDYLVQQLPALRAGLLLTMQVSAIAILLSVVVGLLGASARVLRLPLLSPLIAAYVEFIRNTPLLVQLFFIFFGLPSFGLTLSLFWSGVLALTLWAGAFQVENVRGGLAAVSPGLGEAARALGLTRWQYLRLVGLPLAVRSGLPAMLNTGVSLVKNSAYVSAIGLQDLAGVAFDRIASDFRAFEMLAVLLVGYLALVLSLSAAVRLLEHRLQAPFRR
ncbi:amino acid ABC transporter permease [Plastoroseomonas hellenica]|uniref:Amino acid ABC transporter permease n=1 Tax=Plastoroseomonas hellenica TaxID=2687306 RepID=A0ABS5ERH4_9PROT|nr:amino acid ABC transporter permease [Plastoroseomonas hellenica]MBR0642261.1 amino acid ABC transporter permease [Plastoroseomonas hellenica]MBR0662883.1 amino acid ABC transporter permease [Plastoroseomonas hellenica]